MDELQKKIKEYSPFLEDLFRRIYFVTVFFVAAFVVSFLLSGPLIKYLIKFFDFKDVVLAATSPFQLIDLAMNSGIFFAVVFTVPVILYHTYAFIGSGLRRGEKKFFFLLLPIALLLFLFGFVYSFCILYFAMQTLASINLALGVQNLWNISMFLSEIISTSALLGLIFEFPIFVTVLVKMGVISVDFLKQKRRYAVFIMFIGTSLLPPTDGISLLMMVLPLVIIYEITIIYNQVSFRQLA